MYELYEMCYISAFTKGLNWLIGRRSNLSLQNKVLLYKTVIKQIWVYGIELWGCASKSNISIIQRRQSKILRIITNKPWYVNNQTLHTDLNIPYINDVIKEKSTTHYNKLASHWLNLSIIEDSEETGQLT
jgi:hypothetical protein